MCTFRKEGICSLQLLGSWTLIQNPAPLYLLAASRDNGRPVRFRSRNWAGVPPRCTTHILVSITLFRPMAGGKTHDSTVSDLGELHIQLKYTVCTSHTTPDQSLLRRVSKVHKDLHTLALLFQNSQPQTNRIPSSRYKPKRRPTFDFSNLSSDEESDQETNTTAKMSSEKASNPKDKLEGTYEDRA